eukprot:361512-Chlamydomonas_euryale.AAC.4
MRMPAPATRGGTADAPIAFPAAAHTVFALDGLIDALAPLRGRFRPPLPDGPCEWRVVRSHGRRPRRARRSVPTATSECLELNASICG